MSEFSVLDWVALIFGCALGVMVIAVVVSRRRSENTALGNTFRRLASKYNGTVENGGRFDKPRLKLRHEDIEAELFIEARGSKSRKYYIVFSAVFPFARPYKIRVYRELRVFGIGTVFGQDLKTGNPEFDEAFVVQGSDEEITRGVLSPEVQLQLLALKDRTPVVDLREGRLRVDIDWFLTDEQQFDQVLDAGLALLKSIKAVG